MLKYVYDYKQMTFVMKNVNGCSTIKCFTCYLLIMFGILKQVIHHVSPKTIFVHTMNNCNM